MLSRLAILVSAVLLLFVPRVWAEQTLENPQPGSFQSGVGVISGWACDAQEIEISFNYGPRFQAGSGTAREDTAGVCGDTDNGFGLLTNWNRLGDGAHTVTAYADGVEFARVTVIVTTLGEEFRRDLDREVVLPDFPTSGAAQTLRWSQAQQNFIITAGSPQGGGTSGAAPHVLENPQPGSFQSGVGVISGWACDAQEIEISFNGGPRFQAGSGTAREDTTDVCGDTDNGFGLLYNWNRLGDGTHTVTAYADGAEFASVTVIVTTLGEEFRRDLDREVTLLDFPDAGTDSVVVWQESQQNFAIASALPTGRLVGVSPAITLPASVTSVQAGAVSVATLHSPTGQVRASPESTLILATDAGGTVLLSLANMDGGLLGEAPGEVGVSIDSTAVVLVALAAGYRIPDIDQRLVDEITAHAEYPALLTALTQRLQADKNFLDRIMEHTEVVRLIRQVAGTESAQQLYAQWSAASESVLPEGKIKTNFYGKSPWKKGEPWTWFGESVRLTPTPPFLAVSDHGEHAAGNPNHVDYALEVYHNDTVQDWYYIPGNGSLIEKNLLNSGAALSGFQVPGPQAYSGPDIDRMRFARYRLSADSGRAATLSFLNTTKLLLTTAGIVVSTKAVETWLKKLNIKTTHRALAECGTSLATAVSLPAGTTASKATLAHWFIANIGSGVQAVANCVKKPELAQAVRGDPLGLAKTLAGWGVEISKGVGKWANPIGWAWIGFEVGNELLPAWLSYLSPKADSVDYYLNWHLDGSAELVRVSTTDLPPAPTNLRVESTGADSITLTWAGGQGHYRVYRWASAREQVRVSTITTRQYTAEGLEAGEHCFTVVSVDSQGMESLPSVHQCGEVEGEAGGLCYEGHTPITIDDPDTSCGDENPPPYCAPSVPEYTPGLILPTDLGNIWTHSDRAVSGSYYWTFALCMTEDEVVETNEVFTAVLRDHQCEREMREGNPTNFTSKTDCLNVWPDRRDSEGNIIDRPDYNLYFGNSTGVFRSAPDWVDELPGEEAVRYWRGEPGGQSPGYNGVYWCESKQACVDYWHGYLGWPRDWVLDSPPTEQGLREIIEKAQRTCDTSGECEN